VVRHKFLLLTLVIVLSLSSGAKSTVEASQPTSGCSSADLLSGGCSVSGSINGGGVDLSGHEGGAGTSPGNSRGGGTSKNPTKPKPKTPDPVCTSLPEACQDIRIIGPGAPGNPALTINDLRNFPAVPGTDHMQPNGWMVVGLATNFYATVGSSGSGTELVDGTLLGHPATVRFTPVDTGFYLGGAGHPRIRSNRNQSRLHGRRHLFHRPQHHLQGRISLCGHHLDPRARHNHAPRQQARSLSG
jgi:hypothetical protein